MLKLTTLLLIRLVSYIGSYIGFLAMNIFILSLGFSPVFLARIFFLRVISAIFTLPIVGYLSDIWSRKLIMVITDLTMASMVLGLIIIPKSYLSIYIPIFMTVAGALSNVFDITLNASIPVIIGKQNSHKLLKINSWMLAGKHSAIILSGIMISISYYIFKNYYAIFAIDALSYLLSAIVISLLRIKTNEKLNKSKTKNFNIFTDYKKTILSVKSTTVLVILLLIFANTFATSTNNISWPLISKLLSHNNPSILYGYIIAAWGLGNVLGIYLLNNKNIFRHQVQLIEKYFLFGQLIVTAGFATALLFNNIIYISLLVLLGGIGDGINKNLSVLYFQQFDDSIRGKLFAITNSTNRAGFALGFFVSSLLLRVINTIQTSLLLYGFLLFLILTTYILLKIKPMPNKKY